METSHAITFIDLESGDEAFVSVRKAGDGVGLAVSLKTDGDIEVVLPQDRSEELSGALRAITAQS